ncbi:UPF0193 protein EVG1 isoform X2 [Dendropsophus ebraccatus]|uniref:UPF0193 protein EVG1 isoform X2 n=1 Tax=Dendropsophus ebraccatus TaxID=150705 RepID=UPI00383108D8
MSQKDGNVQVPMGSGFWTSSKPPQYSKETQDLLKVMMQESKLTNFQQRQIREQLQSGGALPIQCHPSSSNTQTKAPVTAPRPAKASITKTRPSLRPAERCRAGDAYTRERFQPKATKDLNKEKNRLQNLMATGKELPDVTQVSAPQTEKDDWEERDRFDELVAEIQERWDFLAEMEALGRGKQYYNMINTEISQKLREMEIIDKQRSSELQEALRKAENKMPGLTSSPDTCS